MEAREMASALHYQPTSVVYICYKIRPRTMGERDDKLRLVGVLTEGEKK
jgi:hypothetical protein